MTLAFAPAPPAWPGRPAVPRLGVELDTGVPCRQYDPDLWFADSPADLEVAKTLCGGCPLKIECLAGAIEREEPWGVWGGEIFERGVVVARKRPRGRPRKDDLARDALARTELADRTATARAQVAQRGSVASAGAARPTTPAARPAPRRGNPAATAPRSRAAARSAMTGSRPVLAHVKAA